MKAFTLLFAFLLPFGLLKAQNNSDSLIKKNKVKQTLITNGEKQAGLILYDVNGNITYHEYNDFAGSTYAVVTSTSVYGRDQKLLQTKSTHSSYPKDTTIWNYEYDANKNLVAINDISGHAIFKYTCDASGREIRQVQLLPDGRVLSETISHYSEDGTEKDDTMKMGAQLPVRINKTYYDLLKREIRSESIENGKPRFIAFHLYDNKTKLLIKTTYNEEGDGSQVDGVNYVYDNTLKLSGRLHFKINNGKEFVTGEEHFEYFDNGLIKTYAENINTAIHKMRTFTYSYKFTGQ